MHLCIYVRIMLVDYTYTFFYHTTFCSSCINLELIDYSGFPNLIIRTQGFYDLRNERFDNSKDQ